MDVLINRINTSCLRILYKVPEFDKLEDLAIDKTKKIRIHIRLKLTRIKACHYRSNRSLKNVIFTENNELPIIFDGMHKYSYRKAFSICHSTSTITTIIDRPIFWLDFIELIDDISYFNKSLGNFVESDSVQNYEYDDDKINIEDVSFRNNIIQNLYNKTIYIMLDIQDSSSFSLTDHTIEIIYTSNYFFIRTLTGSYYETSKKNITGTIAAAFVIKDNELLAYYWLPDTEPFLVNEPKTGLYVTQTYNSFLELTASNCSIYFINVYPDIHKYSKIQNMLSYFVRNI